MKRYITAVILVLVVAIMFGCGKQEEKEDMVTPSQSAQSNGGGELQISEEKNINEITGELVAHNEGVFGGTEAQVQGSDEDLEAWNRTISERSCISKLMVSTWGEGRSLTKSEVETVLDALENASPSVMVKMGNPATGGGVCVEAFDSDDEQLWSVLITGNWLVVHLPGDEFRRVLEIEESEVRPIFDIAG